MRHAWTITRKDLTLRIRDRSVIIIGVIAPLALAFIFNLVFGGAFAGDAGALDLDYGVVDDDGGPIGIAFVDVLDQVAADGTIGITGFASEAAGRTAVEDGEIDALFILPAGLSDDVQSGGAATIEVAGNVDAPTSAGIATSIARRFATELATSTVAALTAVESGAADPSQIAALVQEAAQGPAAVRLTGVSAETRQLNPATYFVAGLSIFFMFFVAGLGVTSMLEERRDGTMARLLAAPVSRSTIVGGKALLSLLIGFGSMTILVVASTFLMGAEWGPVAGVILLVGSAVAAVVAVTSLVGSLAKTAEQSGNLQSIVGVTFGMLGGTFVPISDSTSFLGRLRFATPNAWFLQGLADISTGDVAAGIPAVLVLVAIAVVAGIGANLTARKVVTV